MIADSLDPNDSPALHRIPNESIVGMLECWPQKGLEMTDKNETTGNQTAGGIPDFDPFKFQSGLKEIGERSQRLIEEFYNQEKEHLSQRDAGDLQGAIQGAMADSGFVDTHNIQEAFTSLFTAMMSDPQKFAEAQANLWQAI